MSKFLGHEGVAFMVDESTRSDWYRCSCGGTYGRREWHDTCPHSVGPTFEEHVLAAERLARR